MKTNNYNQKIVWTLSDVWIMTWRNLLKYQRLPQLLVFSTIQPVMFVLLFVYVFGGAIPIPGIDYVDYLIPGILVQSVIFGSTQTGIGLSEDLSKGMIDRFHSLPMARSAVLMGRTISDSIRNIFVISLMVFVGYLVGFNFQDGVVNALFAIILIVLFGFCFSWISANIGMMVKDVETAQVAGFIWVFPLVFASSAFVPTGTMPDWLRLFADNSPITMLINSARGLSLGGAQFADIFATFAWMGIILLIFVPLAVNRYKKVA